MGWDEAPPSAEELKPSSWDSMPPQPGEIPEWKDLGKNIIPNATDLLKGSADTALRIGKGINDFPIDATKTAIQELQGKNPMDTPIGQDIKTIGGAVKDSITGIPGAIADLGSKEAWVNRPVSNALTAGSIVAPMFAPKDVGAVDSITNAMEKRGGKMASNLAPVSGNAIKNMKPDLMLEPENVRTVGGKPNPGDLRTETGKRLVQEGVVGGFGQDADARWQGAAQKHQEFGKAVDSALDAIRKENRSHGEWENVEDPLHKQALPVLKSLKDKELELMNDPHSVDKRTARFWRESYNALADAANEKKGMLTLDDLRDEMQHVGKNIENSTEKSPTNIASKQIYGHLADLRDQMVNEIAQTSGKPELSKNLLDANKGYSFYSRIMNGISADAAQGEGGVNVRGAANPERALKYMGVKSLINAAKPSIAEGLINNAPTIGKAASRAGQVLKQTPVNLGASQIPQEVQDYINRRKQRQ